MTVNNIVKIKQSIQRLPQKITHQFPRYWKWVKTNFTQKNLLTRLGSESRENLEKIMLVATLQMIDWSIRKLKMKALELYWFQ